MKYILSLFTAVLLIPRAALHGKDEVVALYHLDSPTALYA